MKKPDIASGHNKLFPPDQEKKMNTIEPISPEAMSDTAWLEHLNSLGPSDGQRYIRSLCMSNGSTEPILWGLRSTVSGRLVNNNVKGVPCLNAFYTRELAERFRCDGNEVVWMRIDDWWRKVQDAAKTGFPPLFDLWEGIKDGQTVECFWPCKTLIESPVLLLVHLYCLKGEKHVD